MGIYYGSEVYAVRFSYFNDDGCGIKIVEVDTSKWLTQNFMDNFKEAQESVEYPENAKEEDKYFMMKRESTTTYEGAQTAVGWWPGRLDDMPGYGSSVIQ